MITKSVPATDAGRLLAKTNFDADVIDTDEERNGDAPRAVLPGKATRD